MAAGVHLQPGVALPDPADPELYARHLSANHLEVGVGTGYFLEHGEFPESEPGLALLDLSPYV